MYLGMMLVIWSVRTCREGKRTWLLGFVPGMFPTTFPTQRWNLTGWCALVSGPAMNINEKPLRKII